MPSSPRLNRIGPRRRSRGSGRIRGAGAWSRASQQVGVATPAGYLTAGCQSSYNVQFTASSLGVPADLWVERASTGAVDHVAMTGISVHNALLNGSADEHLTLRATEGSDVTVWEIWATTEGGCRLSITQTTH